MASSTVDFAAVADIERLIHLAAHRFDSGDFDGFADLFADATIDVGGLAEPIVGRPGVEAFVRDRVILHRGKPRTQHRLTNILIDVDPDGSRATANSYVTVVQGLDGRIETILAGRYVDAFTKVDGAWRFERRRGADGMVGDLSRHLRQPGTGPGDGDGTAGAAAGSEGGAR